MTMKTEVDPKLLKAKDLAIKELLSAPGITGIGYGQKQKNGIFTGETGIIIFVAEKKKKHALSPGDILPSTIEGFKTDVVQGKFKPQLAYRDSSSSELIRLQPGLSVGPAGVAQVGTIGPLCVDGEGNIYAMTCWHVMATLGTGVLYETAVSPGSGEVGGPTEREIGTTGDSMLTADGDAVLIAMTVEGINEVINLHYRVRPPIINRTAEYGYEEKWGRTTGLTSGHVITVGTCIIDYSDFGLGSIEMNGYWLQSYGTPTYVISDSGDSGSLWQGDPDTEFGITSSGLLVAGDGEYLSFACHMKTVLDTLGVSMLPVASVQSLLDSWGSLNVAEAVESVKFRGNLIVVPRNFDLMVRATTTQEKYYRPRFSLVGDEYVEDENGAYVEDLDNPDEYITLAEHPTGGYYPAVEEVYADSGVHYTESG